MAATLLALLDDITSALDDIAGMTQLAAKKTAGVLGDDLALNAQQVSGVRAERELPVVWAVARGSILNKAILVPTALALNLWLPALVTPLLLLGGLYLCFEGAEKLVHRWRHGSNPIASAQQAAVPTPGSTPALDPAAQERAKVRGAIRTDFILSAEIITITLGTVAQAPLATQLAVLAGVAVLMTVGVYGLVALIVKLDDIGLVLLQRRTALAKSLGRALVAAAPRLMRVLTLLGTAAMFLVGGGILSHAWGALQRALSGLPGGAVAQSVAEAGIGLLAGLLAVAGVTAGSAVVRSLRPAGKH